jgi:hypothetical protein
MSVSTERNFPWHSPRYLRRLLTFGGVASLVLLLATAVFAEPLPLKIVDADVVRTPRGETVVVVTMDRESGRSFASFSSSQLGRPAEIWVDGELVSAPVIREPITGGEVRISNPAFTEHQARALAARLKQPDAKVQVIGK